MQIVVVLIDPVALNLVILDLILLLCSNTFELTRSRKYHSEPNSLRKRIHEFARVWVVLLVHFLS